MKAILNDEKFDITQSMFKQLVVRKGNRRIGGDEPQGFDAILHCSFNNVGIGEASCRGYSIDVNVPDAS